MKKTKKINISTKLKLLRKQLKEIQELESEVLKSFPPKEFLVIYQYCYSNEERTKKFYTLEEAKQFIDNLTMGGQHPYIYTISKIIDEK